MKYHVGDTFLLESVVKIAVNSHVGVPLDQAVRMATLTPARIVHMDDRFGSLEVGKDADIVVFTKDYQTIMTMIQGNIVYRRN